MSEIIDAAVRALNDKLGAGFEGSAKFVIGDEGAVMLDSDGVRAADEEAEVTLSADTDTFRAILDGEMDPTSAFMQGKLTVDGDMGQAMQLGALLS
ncbi:sterol carrier family protein [Rhodobacteraceae bacterium WD3A24]|nr:sterol carrier family protein [Rhodobacteraceae bacterium WD3A24]